VFRLLKPEITEARCRACEVMGGTGVDTAEQAREYQRLFKRPWIEEGDFLEEEPCIQRGLLRVYPEEHGRPCPRVELEPRNVEAVTLAGCLMREDSRPLFPMLFERLCDFLPRDEQLQTLQRIHAALQDSQVNEAVASRLKAKKK
jgi:hypothetical protein